MCVYIGGGFIAPSPPAMFETCFAIKQDLKGSVGDIGVCFLEYCEYSMIKKTLPT
jgi:hypothetical protein